MIRESAHTIISTLLEMYLEEDIAEILKDKYPHYSRLIDRMNDAGLRGGFLRWGVKRLMDERESVEGIIDAVLEFQKRKGKLKKRDIFQYKTVEELQQAIEASYRNKITKPVRKKEADYLYDDGRYLILYPKTTKAACHFGRGTKWCISATEARNHFLDYGARKLHVYLVVGKGDLGRHKKIAIAFRDSHIHEVTDTTNTPIPIERLKAIFGAKHDEMLRIMKRDSENRDDPLVYKLTVADAGETEVFDKALEDYKESGDINYFRYALENDKLPVEFIHKFLDIFLMGENSEIDELGMRSLFRKLLKHPKIDDKVIERLIDLGTLDAVGVVAAEVRDNIYDPPKDILLKLLRKLHKLSEKLAADFWVYVMSERKDVPKEAFDLLLDVTKTHPIRESAWDKILKMPSFGDHLDKLLKRNIEDHFDMWRAIAKVGDKKIIDKVLAELPTIGSLRLIESIVTNPDASANHLKTIVGILEQEMTASQLQSSTPYRIVWDIANHPNVTDELLVVLSDPKYPPGPVAHVVKEKGPDAVPEEALLNSAKQEDRATWWIEMIVQWRDQLPKEFFEILVSRKRLPDLTPKQWGFVLSKLDNLDALAQRPTPDTTVWDVILSQSNPEFLRSAYDKYLELLDSEHPSPRRRREFLYKLIKNPNLPDDVIAQLQDHEDFFLMKPVLDLEEKIRSWDRSNAYELAELLNQWSALLFDATSRGKMVHRVFGLPGRDEPFSERRTEDKDYSVVARDKGGDAVVEYIQALPWQNDRFGVEKKEDLGQLYNRWGEKV